MWDQESELEKAGSKALFPFCKTTQKLWYKAPGENKMHHPIAQVQSRLVVNKLCTVDIWGLEWN